jgi:hypothetical protein
MTYRFTKKPCVHAMRCGAADWGSAMRHRVDTWARKYRMDQTQDSRWSEPKFKRQLDRARSANLVKRIEPAVLATAAEGVIQHLCGLAELA